MSVNQEPPADHLLSQIKIGNERVGQPVVASEPEVLANVNILPGATRAVEFKKGKLPDNVREFGERKPGLTPVVFSGDALESAFAHFEAISHQERGGILVGNFIETDSGERFVVVENFLGARDVAATGASVTFTADTWSKGIAEVEEKYPDKVLVGWAHSHPHWVPAPSRDDSFVAGSFFNEPEQVTMIVNPNTKEIGNFRLVDGSLVNAGGILVDMAAVAEDYVRHLFVFSYKDAADQLKYQLHSDIHPGNIILAQDGKIYLLVSGQESAVYLIDRNFYLRLTQTDVSFIQQLLTESDGEQKLRIIVNYFLDLPENKDKGLDKNKIFNELRVVVGLDKLRGKSDTALFNRTLSELTRRNVDLPIPIMILFKNINSIEDMLKKSGLPEFATYLRSNEVNKQNIDIQTLPRVINDEGKAGMPITVEYPKKEVVETSVKSSIQSNFRQPITKSDSVVGGPQVTRRGFLQLFVGLFSSIISLPSLDNLARSLEQIAPAPADGEAGEGGGAGGGVATESIPSDFTPVSVDGVEVFGVTEPIRTKVALQLFVTTQERKNVSTLNRLPVNPTPQQIRSARDKIFDPNKRYIEVVVTRSIYDQYAAEKAKDPTQVSFPEWIKAHVWHMNKLIADSGIIDLDIELRRVVVVEDEIITKGEKFWHVPNQNPDKVWFKDNLSSISKDTDMRWGIDYDLRRLSTANDIDLYGKKVRIDPGLIHEWFHTLLGVGDLYWESTKITKPQPLEVWAFSDDLMSNLRVLNRISPVIAQSILTNRDLRYRGSQVSSLSQWHDATTDIPDKTTFSVKDGNGKLFLRTDGIEHEEQVLNPLDHALTLKHDEVENKRYYLEVEKDNRKTFLPLSRSLFNLFDWQGIKDAQIEINIEKIPSEVSRIGYTVMSEDMFNEVRGAYPGVIAWVKIPSTTNYFVWLTRDRIQEAESIQQFKELLSSAWRQFTEKKRWILTGWAGTRSARGSKDSSELSLASQTQINFYIEKDKEFKRIWTDMRLVDDYYPRTAVRIGRDSINPRVQLTRHWPFLTPLINIGSRFEVSVLSRDNVWNNFPFSGRTMLNGPDFFIAVYEVATWAKNKENYHRSTLYSQQLSEPKQLEMTGTVDEIPTRMDVVGDHTVLFSSDYSPIAYVLDTASGEMVKISPNLKEVTQSLGITSKPVFSALGVFEVNKRDQEIVMLFEIIPFESPVSDSPYKRAMMLLRTDMDSHVLEAKQILSPEGYYPHMIGRYNENTFLVAQVDKNGVISQLQTVKSDGSVVTIMRDMNLKTESEYDHISGNNYYSSPMITIAADEEKQKLRIYQIKSLRKEPFAEHVLLQEIDYAQLPELPSTPWLVKIFNPKSRYSRFENIAKDWIKTNSD